MTAGQLIYTGSCLRDSQNFSGSNFLAQNSIKNAGAMFKPPAKFSVPPSASAQASSTVRRLRTLSYLLDNAIPIPGLNYRVGLDPILGLVPGGGDVLASLMSIYVVFEGARLGLGAPTLGRMGWNILVDTLTGMVPILGDLFDVTWKANSRNVALLEAHLANPTPSRARDRLFAIALITALLALAIAMTVLSIWLLAQLGALLSAVGGSLLSR